MADTCKSVVCGCGIVTRMALSLEVCKQMHLKATSYLPSLVHVVNKRCVDCAVCETSGEHQHVIDNRQGGKGEFCVNPFTI